MLFGVREPVHALASYNGNGESNKRAPETSLRSVLGVRGFPTFRIYVGGKLMEDRLGTIYSTPLRDLLNKAVAAGQGQ